MSNDLLINFSEFETRDFDELSSSSEAWDQQLSQLSPGQFFGSLQLVEVGSRNVIRGVYGKKMRYRGTSPLGAYAFGIPFKQAGKANWVGYKVDDNTVVVQAPGKETHLVTGDFWDNLVISLSEEEVEQVTAALSGNQNILGNNNGVVTLTPQNADGIRSLARNFLEICKADASTDPFRIEMLSDQIAKLFLWELIKAIDPKSMRSSQKTNSRLVNQATDIVMADMSGSVGLSDLCDTLNVSLRSLHYAFNDVTGVSAAAWLRTMRLNSVHRALLHATPAESKVHQIAHQHGFLHIGHFSKQYRQLFGCLPSQTLAAA